MYHLRESSTAQVLTVLIFLIWQIAIPKSWLVLNIVCLYKKGLKSLAENYRALSIGSNLSKLVPRIILNRLQDTYEHNISEAQFGFRKGRSTCDAIFGPRKADLGPMNSLLSVRSFELDLRIRS